MFELTAVREPRWLELPMGVKVEVRPRTTALDGASGAEAARRCAALQRDAEAQAAAGQPMDAAGFNVTNTDVLNGLYTQYQIESIAKFAIIRWEGIVGRDKQPLPVTPDNIAAFAAHPTLAAAFQSKYSADEARVAAEGNGSAKPSAGDTEEVPPTVDPAPSDQEMMESPADHDVDPAPQS